MSRFACARTCASLVTIALLTSSQLLGCASSSSTLKPEATAQAKSAAPIFLWTLSKDGKPGRAHLYGSVHLKPSGQESVDRVVTQTFDAATDLVFEHRSTADVVVFFDTVVGANGNESAEWRCQPRQSLRAAHCHGRLAHPLQGSHRLQ